MFFIKPITKENVSFGDYFNYRNKVRKSILSNGSYLEYTRTLCKSMGPFFQKN